MTATMTRLDFGKLTVQSCGRGSRVVELLHQHLQAIQVHNQIYRQLLLLVVCQVCAF